MADVQKPDIGFTAALRPPPAVDPEAPPGTAPIPRARMQRLDARGKPLGVEAIVQESVYETLWHNPTDKTVVVDLFIGSPVPQELGTNNTTGQVVYRKPRTYEEQTGKRKYEWAPGETRSLPRDYDQGLQQTNCNESECQQQPRRCRDRTHDHTIVGGLAPQLVNLGMQKQPSLHPSLNDELARMKLAEQEKFEQWKIAEQARTAAAIAEAKQEIAERDLAERAKHEAEAAVAHAKAQSGEQPQHERLKRSQLPKNT